MLELGIRRLYQWLSILVEVLSFLFVMKGHAATSIQQFWKAPLANPVIHSSRFVCVLRLWTWHVLWITNFHASSLQVI